MEAFYEAFIHCEHRVLGKLLKPFCLRHCLYLEAIHSPVIALINGAQVALTRKDLELAVLICSAQGNILSALKRPFGMRLYRFKPQCTRFLSYLSDYLALPDVWDKTEGNNTLNAPWILSKATLLLAKTTLTQNEIWTMPIGELFWYIAALAEQEGAVQIQTEEEQRALKEMEALRGRK